MAAGVAVTGLQEIRVKHYQDQMSTLQEAKEAAAVAALTEKQTIEATWSKKYEELDQKSKEDAAQALLVSASADAERSRLLDAIDKYRGAVRSVIAIGSPNQPGDDPIGVFAKLLGETDRVAGVYAKLADDRGRIAQRCEASYEVISHSGSKQK